MRNIDMIFICNKCPHHRSIYYADGTIGIGCLAYNVESVYPVNIRYIEHCPLEKDEKR